MMGDKAADIDGDIDAGDTLIVLLLDAVLLSDGAAVNDLDPLGLIDSDLLLLGAAVVDGVSEIEAVREVDDEGVLT